MCAKRFRSRTAPTSSMTAASSVTDRPSSWRAIRKSEECTWARASRWCKKTSFRFRVSSFKTRKILETRNSKPETMVLLQHKLSVKLSQRQILTPGLVQMVSVLALNKLELKDMINAEMVENPVLEELEDS